MFTLETLPSINRIKLVVSTFDLATSKKAWRETVPALQAEVKNYRYNSNNGETFEDFWKRFQNLKKKAEAFEDAVYTRLLFFGNAGINVNED